MKIIPVDCNYVQPEFATSYLLVQTVAGEKRGFFIECNTNYAIPYLIEAAKKEGLRVDQIDGLAITHVHLDHAGGAGLFLKEFPNAKLYAHPRAAKHAIDPSKLIASATQVYGEEFMQKMYGTILPCSADRVVIVEDGVPIHWDQITFETRHTRGHANHHICLMESSTRTLFSGDAFGVCYPKIHNRLGLVVVASTSPTDFDGLAAIETVKWIRDQKPKQVALTHYSFLKSDEISPAAEQLIDQLQFAMNLVEQIKADRIDVDRVAQLIEVWMVQYYALQGLLLDQEAIDLLKIDFKVNAQGLMFTAAKSAAH